ncbi:MAG: SpoIID/LytB domain-containing protein [Lachnospiraceae bacterium]|nr:SpoIID/LytB domain-containing protein [Lachnospiraceae bacterium]
MADVILVIFLTIQIFKANELTGENCLSGLTDGQAGEYLQYLKSTVSRAGEEFFGDLWDNIFEDGEKENSAGDSSADGNDSAEHAADGSSQENAGEGAAWERANADISSADASGSEASDPDGVAAVNFAAEEELTAETAEAIGNFREITVLITNKGEGGYCHSTLSFSFTADIVLTTGDGVVYFEAGDTLELDAADYAEGNIISLERAADFSAEDAGEDAVIRIDFSAEEGESDVRTYAGTMDITVTEDGFLLRNTLPLEEYLRFVVPAEMPASYPEEALKAQAICARTYALRTAVSGTFADYGADISDDTSCQVYNTQGTDERTDAAVLATAGEYLVFEGEAAECYYFSTSCGVTTDASIWGEEIPYLKTVLVSDVSADSAGGDQAAESEISEPENPDQGGEDDSEAGGETEDKGEMEAEENTVAGEKSGNEEETETGKETGSGEKSGNEEDAETGKKLESEEEIKAGEETELSELLKIEEYLHRFLDEETACAESEEAWYRWEASFSPADLATRLDGEIGTVFAVEVTQRGSGGVAAELTVYGSSGQKVIESQYAIREFFRLGDGASCTRQDGTVVSTSMLLPSAFFYIQAETDGTVTLVGGGFGHGCGMSQNAAKAYANGGADAYEIVSFFFPGTKIYAGDGKT